MQIAFITINVAVEVEAGDSALRLVEAMQWAIRGVVPDASVGAAYYQALGVDEVIGKSPQDKGRA